MKYDYHFREEETGSEMLQNLFKELVSSKNQ